MALEPIAPPLTCSQYLEIGETLAPELRGRLFICESDPQWPTSERTLAYSRAIPWPWVVDRWPEARDKITIVANVQRTPFTPGLFLHELGHAVNQGQWLFAAEITKDPALAYSRAMTWGQCEEYLASRERMKSSSENIARGPLPWEDHAREWIRTVIHLHWRWEQAFRSQFGIIPYPDLGIAGNAYGLSPAWKYFEAMADEPRTMAGEALGPMMSENYRPQFARLFSDDAVRYIERQARERETLARLEAALYHRAL